MKIHDVFESLWRMLRKKHSTKSATWIRNKYFTRIGSRKWCFYTKVKSQEGKKLYTLVNASDTKIRRHIKIRGKAHIFNQDFDEYFLERENKRKKAGINSWIVERQS